MAKPIVFQLGDTDLAFTMTKVDRAKLYGFKEVEALDDRGERCELATLADDGRTIIGRGGTAFGYLNADGQWCDKSQLVPVDAFGNQIVPVPSSFTAPTKLFDVATVDELMQHNIRSAYLLTSENDLTDLMFELNRGTIFSFPYSYRGGLEADAGFMTLSDDRSIFLLVGTPTKTQFIGLQTAPPEEDSLEAVDEGELMDFDMI